LNLYSALLLVAADGNQPVQMKLHKSLRLWTFYVDLEESLGNLESTREVYERILDLRIATPQVIINYAYFLEVWSNIYVLVQYLFWILLLLVVAH
jgi:pre-mRNA-splicing factor SYF1